MTILREHIIDHQFLNLKIIHIENRSCLYIFLSINKNLWCVVTDGPFIPKGNDDVVKHPKDWDDSKTKKASYDLKARNILIYALVLKCYI